MFSSRLKHLRTMYLLSFKINSEVFFVKAPARPGIFGDLWVMLNTVVLLFSREKCSLRPSTRKHKAVHAHLAGNSGFMKLIS